ncbi:MAG: hypothetical protein HKL88_07685 [Bacteroidia bacterium]|nr:hypothetical protein [Bacteroidia bacterium]
MNAQSYINNYKKFSIGLNFGISIPKGQFGEANSTMLPLANHSQDTNHFAGYAQTGFYMNVNFNYMFTNIIGCSIYIGTSANPYNSALFKSQIDTLYATEFRNSGGIPLISTSGNYFIGQYLIGPFMCIPVSGKLKAEIKLLFGYIFATYPKTDFGTNFELPMPASFKFSFCYSFSGGIEYVVSKTFGFHLNVNYIGSNATYPSYSEQPYGTFKNELFDIPKNMSIMMIEPTLGVSVDFGSRKTKE